ncbi:GTPase IMAP family member 8-like isoform X2, partial [Silurus asotus]
DLRIVLLGKAGSKKNRVAKAILGDIELYEEHEKCVLYEGEHAGKSICIVDTPGWDRVSIECTTKKIKNEITRSVTLCPPGPHALILVLPVNTGDVPSQNELKSSSRHVELLSERVWNYTMVLFLCDRDVQESTITEHIQEAEKLLEKCSGRHCVMRLSESETQINGLLKEIESMVEEYLEILTNTLQNLVEHLPKRVEAVITANETKCGIGCLKSHLCSCLYVMYNQYTYLRIVLLGKSGAGKNRVAKAILGDIELYEESEECVLYEGEHAGKSICIVDTPGWDRVSIECTTKKIKNEISRSVTLCPPGPDALILVLPVNTGDVPSLNELESTSGHVELLSERVWNHTMVLFLCDRDVEESTITAHIQKSEKLLEKCSGRHCVMRLSESESQVCALLKKIESMVEEKQGYFSLTEGYYEEEQGKTGTQEETNKKQGEEQSEEKHR